MAFVQSHSVTGVGVTSVACTPTSAITAGSLVVIAVSGWARAAAAGNVTDTRNPAAALDQAGNGANAHGAVYSTPNAAAGSTTWTYAPSGAAQDTDIAVHEYSLMDTGSPKDKSVASVNASASSTYACGTTAATTQATETIFYMATSEGDNNTGTPPTGTVTREKIMNPSNMPINTADKAVSSTGTQTGSFTNNDSQPSVGIIVTYKAALASVFPVQPGRGPVSPLYRM